MVAGRLVERQHGAPGTRPRAAVRFVCSLAICLVGGSTACQRPSETNDVLLPAGSPSYWSELAQVCRRLDNASDRAERMPLSATPWLEAGRLALTRARLTGAYADLELAQSFMGRGAAMDRAAAHVDVAEARLAVHRYDEAQAELEAAQALPLPNPDRARVERASARLALARGHFAQARRQLGDLARLTPDDPPCALMGLVEWETGELAEAERVFARCERGRRGQSPATRAWFRLQRGQLAMDQGRYDDAIDHYHNAAAILPGYWLIEEHLAEAMAANGDIAGAASLYSAVVFRNPRPDVADALARLQRDAGDAESERWFAALARVGHELRLARYPDVASGHAVEHFIEFGSSARAVQLASDDVRRRGHPRTRLMLARAHAAAGQLDVARAEASRVAGSQWRHADIHATLAGILAASGEHEAARAQLTQARAINPRARAWSVPSGRSVRPIATP